MSLKLNQTIAVEKGVKSRAHSEVSELYKLVQKPGLFNGLARNYTPKQEDGESQPNQNQKVQETVDKVLKRLKNSKSELYNITAQKDFANMQAKADVVVNGTSIIKDAPVPFLLFLEKEITDLRTFVLALPVLDSNDEWSQDVNSGLFKSEAVQTTSSKKIQKPIVLFPATEFHPAQTQLITEDIIAGTWETIKHSGAMTVPAKEKMVENVEVLLKAVKIARESANQQEVEDIDVGSAIFNQIFDI